MDTKKLTDESLKWREWYNKGQKQWSTLHHFCLFGSIISSVAAGAVLQMKESDFSSLATIATSIAAALTGLAASGGFERKWRSNRISRSKIDQLLLDLGKADANPEDLTNVLKEIIDQHDFEVVGERDIKRDLNKK